MTKEKVEDLQSLTKEQRTALYEFLTGRAYRLNTDGRRKDALETRKDLMESTLSKDNAIPFDRLPKLKPMGDYLPNMPQE